MSRSLTANHHRWIAASFVLATLVWCCAVGVQPAHAAFKSCDVAGKQLGPTTVNSLSVSRTTCSAGEKLVTAYYNCRAKNGMSGRCVTKVLGYACRESRQTTTGQFSASVTCTKGSKNKKKTVKHSYTQSTS